MPFSISHIAAVVPLGWIDRRVALSALAFGSMAPDFHYLLGDLDVRSLFGELGIRSPSSDFDLRSLTHSTLGIFTVSWAVGVLTLWVYHGYLKVPLLWLLPAGHRERLHPVAAAFYWGSPRHTLGMVLLVLLGALTHKAWDTFTHQSAVTYRLGLDRALLTIDGTPVQIYSLLQWASSIGGLLILAVWYAQWYRRQPAPQVSPTDSQASRARFLGALLLLATAYAMIAASITVFGWNNYEPGLPTTFNRLKIFTGYNVMCALMSTALIVWVYATVFWLHKVRSK